VGGNGGGDRGGEDLGRRRNGVGRLGEKKASRLLRGWFILCGATLGVKGDLQSRIKGKGKKKGTLGYYTKKIAGEFEKQGGRGAGWGGVVCSLRWGLCGRFKENSTTYTKQKK